MIKPVPPRDEPPTIGEIVVFIGAWAVLIWLAIGYVDALVAR